jgi:hypothetical protein
VSFVRPELAVLLRRWGEALVFAAVLALGLWLLWRAVSGRGWLLLAPGLVLAGSGAGLLMGAVRRIRLSDAPPGAGVVMIDEGRIAYFGPLGGGFVDLPGLIRVEITGEAWLLVADDGTRLAIPRGAAGAERLPDALSPLPGLDLDAAVAAIGTGAPGRTLLWRADRRPPRVLPR